MLSCRRTVVRTLIAVHEVFQRFVRTHEIEDGSAIVVCCRSRHSFRKRVNTGVGLHGYEDEEKEAVASAITIVLGAD